MTATETTPAAPHCTSLAGSLADGILCISNGCSCDVFDIVKTTEKALQIHDRNLSKYPVWVPLAAIKEERNEIPEIGVTYTLKFASWFVRKMWAEGKSWQRVALGLSVW